jgi:maltooligosyltrehalose trehalohydrolase
MRIGANYGNNHACEFSVWAPLVKNLSLKLLTPSEKLVPMDSDDQGYWKVSVNNCPPGTLYWYHLDNERDRPDPASFYQPDGVHRASQVIDHQSFAWQDTDWHGIDKEDMIIYEIHVGTFTDEGTFASAMRKLDDLEELGINAIEIMPVSQFPGSRNWGYDGVYPFAVQNSYGGPDGLKGFVNACHMRGIAVILDVVYNHLGPEGNYIWDFGPYFTEKYKSPWGQAINFDGEHNQGVRNYFIENAICWFEYFHCDALRLDAIHGIYDTSKRPFLQELADNVQEFSARQKRKYYLMAESDLNDSSAAKPAKKGGLGLDVLWCDDFHHAMHTLIAGEDSGYYIDYGSVDHLVKSLQEGFVYSGEYSKFRKRNHGTSSRELSADSFIVFSQNHDQVGNRVKGDRIASLVSFEAQKLAAGIILLSPFIPLLFMGEEHGETNPFHYFTSHSDPGLIEGIRQGRKKEFEKFRWKADPADPQREETYALSKIDWNKRVSGDYHILLNFYRELIRLRKDIAALSHLNKESMTVRVDDERKVIMVERWHRESRVLSIINTDSSDVSFMPVTDDHEWKKIMDSSESKWHGPGTLLKEKIKGRHELEMRAHSLALYEIVKHQMV